MWHDSTECYEIPKARDVVQCHVTESPVIFIVFLTGSAVVYLKAVHNILLEQ